MPQSLPSLNELICQAGNPDTEEQKKKLLFDLMYQRETCGTSDVISERYVHGTDEHEAWLNLRNALELTPVGHDVGSYYVTALTEANKRAHLHNKPELLNKCRPLYPDVMSQLGFFPKLIQHKFVAMFVQRSSVELMAALNDYEAQLMLTPETFDSIVQGTRSKQSLIVAIHNLQFSESAIDKEVGRTLKDALNGKDCLRSFERYFANKERPLSQGLKIIFESFVQQYPVIFAANQPGVKREIIQGDTIALVRRLFDGGDVDRKLKLDELITFATDEAKPKAIALLNLALAYRGASPAAKDIIDSVINIIALHDASDFLQGKASSSEVVFNVDNDSFVKVATPSSAAALSMEYEDIVERHSILSELVFACGDAFPYAFEAAFAPVSAASQKSAVARLPVKFLIALFDKSTHKLLNALQSNAAQQDTLPLGASLLQVGALVSGDSRLSLLLSLGRALQESKNTDADSLFSHQEIKALELAWHKINGGTLSEEDWDSIDCAYEHPQAGAHFKQLMELIEEAPLALADCESKVVASPSA